MEVSRNQEPYVEPQGLLLEGHPQNCHQILETNIYFLSGSALNLPYTSPKNPFKGALKHPSNWRNSHIVLIRMSSRPSLYQPQNPFEGTKGPTKLQKGALNSDKDQL